MSSPSRALLVVSLCSLAIAFGENSTVRGELRDGAEPLDRYAVYLVSSQRGSDSDRAYVSSSGSFQFRSVVPGNYMLEVRNMQGDVIRQQSITVAGMAVEAFVSLGHTRPAVTPGQPSISVSQLRRDPDGRAARELAQGEEFLLRKDLSNARKHFVRALKVDPDYAEAHAELGTCAFRAGQMDEAKQEFERAVALDPKQIVAWGNLATMLFQSKTFGQAEQVARQGLAAEPGDRKLHFVLGAARFGQGVLEGDTVEHLELASVSYPNAHLMAAEALVRLGDMKRARPHLEASLISNNAAIRARAEYLLGKLERSPAK